MSPRHSCHSANFGLHLLFSMSAGIVKPPTTLELFIQRQQELLRLEREAEEAQTRLLNSKCSPKLLEKKGLALGGLGVASVNIGLGGKT
jgi:DNA polymerase alpha-associated DNA helicase A